MSSEREQLEVVIQGLEAQRGLLGEAFVDAGLAPLRARLAAVVAGVECNRDEPVRMTCVQVGNLQSQNDSLATSGKPANALNAFIRFHHGRALLTVEIGNRIFQRLDLCASRILIVEFPLLTAPTQRGNCLNNRNQ